MATALSVGPKAAFLPAAIDACAMYRQFMPHLHIPGSMFLFRMDRLDLSMLEGYDVVVVQRQVTPQNYKALQTLRRAGKKIIYDLDDHVWALPAANPAQQYFKMMREGFGICLQEIHLLTVSTRMLKTAVQTVLPNLNKEILVTPNAVDFDLFRPSGLERDDSKVVLGWAGSNTHDGDMLEVADVLPDMLRKHSNLHLEFVGGQPPKKLNAMERVRSRPWVPVGEFANRFSSWSWDFTMAPLENNRFNGAKSGIKLLEAAAVKIPCLVSNVRPYYEFCALGGKELEWLLCDTQRDWKVKLEKLINEPEYRKYLGELMHKTARRYFDIKDIKDLWCHAIRTVAA